MTYDFYNRINELMGSNPNEAIKSFESHEKELLDNPIDLHFIYNHMIDICYKYRENEMLLNKCVDICEKDIEITPQVINLMKNDPMWKHYNEDGVKVFTPPHFPSFQRLAIIYEKQGKYKEAIKICEKAISYELKDGTKGGFEGRIEKLNKKNNNPPKPTKPPSNETIEKQSKLQSTSIELANKHLSTTEDGFMISFSKSTSKNFDRAVFLAEQADEFKISTHNNQEIYQALYHPDNFLNFITLYELIGGWKSTFVFKNGNIVDRKILGQINYCHGDKLRSGNSEFCYGASMFTENPFGCHRLMIHSGQKPWYEWKKGENNRYIFIDKDAMKNQIDAKAKVYSLCPAFNYNEIMEVLNGLPSKIDKKSKMYKDLYSRSPYGTITLEVNLNDDINNRSTNKSLGKPKTNVANASTGCATLLLLLIVVVFILII